MCILMEEWFLLSLLLGALDFLLTIEDFLNGHCSHLYLIGVGKTMLICVPVLSHNLTPSVLESSF